MNISSSTLRKAVWWIAVAAAAFCFLLTLPMIFHSFGGAGLTQEIIIRRIAYCFWRDTSLASIDLPIHTSLVLAVFLGPLAAAIRAALKSGCPRWYVPIFVIAAYLAGTMFVPQFFLHSHFHEPSTRYFIRNLLIGLTGSILLFAVFAAHQKTKRRSSMLALAGLFVPMAAAFYLMAAFFYTFNPFYAVE